MLAAVSDGDCAFTGALAAGDTRSSAACLRALGIRISPIADGRAVRVSGKGLGGLRKPARRLQCGNSGTTARLLMGMLAASPFEVTLTGDASLRRRPMERIASPLRTMGARIELTQGRLPARERGGRLTPIRYASPVASAQVKSALLLAALRGGIHVSLSEPVRSRDHTERLLGTLGVRCRVSGVVVDLDPADRIPPFGGEIPGDFSSAAYLIAAALLLGRRDVSLEGVGVNPTRTGFLRAIERMGASVEATAVRQSLGEPVATLTPDTWRPGPVEVSPDEVPGMVDEIPLLACLAARAPGTSVFRGVGELRVKESDRLALVATNLAGLGCRAWTEGDTLWVEGTEARLEGRIRTEGDHRLAMAFSVLGVDTDAAVEVDDPECVQVSYPGFFRDLRSLCAGSRHHR